MDRKRHLRLRSLLPFLLLAIALVTTCLAFGDVGNQNRYTSNDFGSGGGDDWGVLIGYLLGLFIAAFVVAFFLLMLIIWATPLRNYLPGYNEDLRKEFIAQTYRLDSLQQEMELRAVYLNSIRDVVSGNVLQPITRSFIVADEVFFG